MEMKLKMLKERLAGRKDGELLRELKRKEEELLSVASIQVRLSPQQACISCRRVLSRRMGLLSVHFHRKCPSRARCAQLPFPNQRGATK